MKYNICLLEEIYLDGIAEIEKQCFSEPWSRESLKLLLSEGVGFAAVSEDNAVVGYVGMMTVLDEGQITNIAVSREYRHMGIGTAMLQRLFDYCGENGISELSLEVRASNGTAISLYEKEGFVRCGIRRGFYKFPSEDALVMIKKL